MSIFCYLFIILRCLNKFLLMQKQYSLPFILITSLFFLWGIAHNLNPILIPHLKKACQLSDFQSALIDSAFYVAYFAMALPAGKVMHKYGYKFGIIGGLVLFALGAFLFIPAANTRVFALFLAALFIIASGLTFLETAANPYVTVLGSPQTASQRINFAQSFNGLAASIAPFLGGMFILSGKHLSQDQSQAMTAAQLASYLDAEAATVKIPYLIIGLVVLFVALLVYKVQLPEVSDADKHELELGQSGASIWRHSHVRWAVAAQFFYVGAQVCVSSFFIRYMDSTAHMPEKQAANFLSVALLLFMIGRFVGTVLMRYIEAHKLLSIYALLNILLLAFVVAKGGMLSAYALCALEFFMSIMFPTIFSLGLAGLSSSETKIASSYLVMAIVGGAIFPLIMGRVSDASGIQWAYIVPLLCFFVIFWFAYKKHRPVSI